MSKKINKGKATSPKMVPESEVLNALTEFTHKVVFGNEETRMVLLEAIDTHVPEEQAEHADDIADMIMMLVCQDDEWREHYFDELQDNDLAMGLFDAAMEIRAILNLDAFDEMNNKIQQILKLEDEAKGILCPKSTTPDEEVNS